MDATKYSTTDLLRRWSTLGPVLERISNQHPSEREQEALGILLQLAEAEVERLKSLRPEDGFFGKAIPRRVAGW